MGQLLRCCHSSKCVNMADLYNKLSSSSGEDWKMTRYIPGISIIKFASFLAWTGLVSSVIFIIGSLDMIFTPLALGIHRYSRGCGHYSYSEVFCGSLYGVGALVLLMNIGNFIYSFKLWKAINSDNMMGMRNLIKIGCYIMGGLELVAIALLGVNGLFIGLLTIPIIISGGFMALISLMIHGVRKFKPGLVNIYIIFKIVIFTLFAILTLVQIIMGLVYIGALGWLTGV